MLSHWDLVWVVIDDDPMAAATTRITTDGFAEVILVGGKGWQGWIADLSRLICAWAKDEGMASVRAYGRKGWVKILPQLGWRVVGEDNEFTGYERLI